jgi:hypothetical protein
MITYAIVQVIEEKFVDEAKGKVYLKPIKLCDRASWDKFGVKGFNVWSNVMGW